MLKPACSFEDKNICIILWIQTYSESKSDHILNISWSDIKTAYRSYFGFILKRIYKIAKYQKTYYTYTWGNK